MTIAIKSSSDHNSLQNIFITIILGYAGIALMVYAWWQSLLMYVGAVLFNVGVVLFNVGVVLFNVGVVLFNVGVVLQCGCGPPMWVWFSSMWVWSSSMWV